MSNTDSKTNKTRANNKSNISKQAKVKLTHNKEFITHRLTQAQQQEIHTTDKHKESSKTDTQAKQTTHTMITTTQQRQHTNKATTQ